MTLTFNLTEEQLDVIKKRTASYNKAAGTSLSEADFLLHVLTGEIDGWVSADFQSAVKEFGELSKKKSYRERKGLFQELKTRLA